MQVQGNTIVLRFLFLILRREKDGSDFLKRAKYFSGILVKKGSIVQILFKRAKYCSGILMKKKVLFKYCSKELNIVQNFL